MIEPNPPRAGFCILGIPMSQNERRQALGRREEDFEAPALRASVATHDALIHRMRQQIAALERDVETVLAHLTQDPQVDIKALRSELIRIENAMREFLA
jgi:hypothetical protein